MAAIASTMRTDGMVITATGVNRSKSQEELTGNRQLFFFNALPDEANSTQKGVAEELIPRLERVG